MCNCNLNINNKNHNYNEENYFEIEEDDNNFINYLLDKINYEIYKCYSLLYVFDNYRKKIAFYGLIFILLIYIILIIRFFAHRIFSIRKAIINNIKKSKKILLSKSLKKLKSFNIKHNPMKHKTKRNIKNNGQTNMIFKNVNIYMLIKINQSKAKVESNKIIKRKSKRGLTVNVSSISKRMKIDENDFNDLPYNKAIIYDKRDFLMTFTSVLLEKIELINIFNNNKTKVKELILCQYLLSLIVDFYFNAIFYSDDIISHKFHNKGKLNFIVSFLLSFSAIIISSILLHLTSYLKGLEEKIELMMEIKVEYKVLKILSNFMLYIKIKVSILSLFHIVIILYCYIYIMIFLIIYSRCQMSLLKNCLMSFIDNIVISIVISTIIVITRKIGINFNNKNIYNTSKYIHNHF